MDQAKIEEGKTLIKELIQNQPEFSNVDTRKGTVVYEILIGLAALGYGFLAEQIDLFEKSNSLSMIVENNTDVDDTVIDSLLANWFLSRTLGKKSYGKAKVLASSARDYFIGVGTGFATKTGLGYVAKEDTDIQQEELQPELDGNFSFVLDLEAAEVGSLYSVLADTAFDSAIYPNNVVEINAVSDFVPGEDSETNSQLLNRTQEEISLRDFASLRSIRKIILEEFSDIKEIRALGMDNREMQRDRNGMGMKVGGKVDVYVNKEEVLSEEQTLTTDSDGIVFLSTELSPIMRVKNFSLAVNPITKLDSFGIETMSTLAGLEPNFARFSSFEKIKVVTDQPERDIIVRTDRLAGISDIQIFVEEKDIENIVQSTLVKCFMPCFLSAGIQYVAENGTSVDEEALLGLIVNYINTYKDNENMFYVSKLVDFIVSLPEIKSITLPLDLTGEYHLPDGTKKSISSPNVIEIEPDYILGYSNLTYAFYAISEDFTVTEEL
jgi:hypothetical protein